MHIYAGFGLQVVSCYIRKEAHESTLLRQKEDLQDWEKKLQEGQQRLSESQGLLNKRESRLNDANKLVNQKERDLEESKKKIDAANMALKEKETVLCTRLADVGAREEVGEVTFATACFCLSKLV